MKVREVIAFKNYFEKFLSEQTIKVQDKIYKIIEAIETLERVPSNYLKHIDKTYKIATFPKYLIYSFR